MFKQTENFRWVVYDKHNVCMNIIVWASNEIEAVLEAKKIGIAAPIVYCPEYEEIMLRKASFY